MGNCFLTSRQNVRFREEPTYKAIGWLANSFDPIMSLSYRLNALEIPLTHLLQVYI